VCLLPESTGDAAPTTESEQQNAQTAPRQSGRVQREGHCQNLFIFQVDTCVTISQLQSCPHNAEQQSQ
jgi:hypothetical protein